MSAMLSKGLYAGSPASVRSDAVDSEYMGDGSCCDLY